MARAVRKSIRFTVGDGWARKLGFYTLVDNVKTARDVTESEFLSQVRRRPNASTILATVTILNQNDIPALEPNEIIMVLYPADTIAISRDAVYDLQETAVGSSPQTKFKGNVFAHQQVSRP